MIYLFNSSEYLTASKTVTCKHHCRLVPRNLPVFFFFTIQISSVKFKITADTVVCHFSFLYRWLEEDTRVIWNYIRDVINYLKKGFSHASVVFAQYRGICLGKAWYLPSTVVFAQANTTLYEIPKDKYPSDGEKRKKTKNW